MNTKQTRVFLEYNRSGRIERVAFAYGATRNDIEVVPSRGLVAIAVEAEKLDIELRKQLSRAKFASDIAPALKGDYAVGPDGLLRRITETNKARAKASSASAKVRPKR